MEASTQQRTPWSSAQVYAMAIICLLLGVSVGYLLRTPAAAGATAPRPVQENQAASRVPPRVTAAQLREMSDKQAEPLRAQLQKHPNDAKLLGQIGSVYLAGHQFPVAREYFERSTAIKPDAAVLTQLADTYYFTNDVDKSIATLHRALQVDPAYGTALYNLGMLEWQVKLDPKSAIADWEKLLKVNPDDPNRAQVEQLIARAKRHLAIAPGTKTDKPAM
jgi:cytochrome c-type biogenesis protein CcmH/NrfG